ncbi:MAG: flagellar hook-basal body complex protein FliE [Ruminiclostridium sp.]|jgi:flagellar hook-basal body complex protein FliE|nr:flagellar hook-basal body complex protein FliE [Ruminiclostridium sp.]
MIGNTGMGIENTIRTITPFEHRSETPKERTLTEVGESAFGSLFRSLIQDVKDTDAEFVNAQYLLSTGQLDNPAELGLAGYKNEIAVDLLVQMRNKALDVYNELKNINI